MRIGMVLEARNEEGSRMYAMIYTSSRGWHLISTGARVFTRNTPRQYARMADSKAKLAHVLACFTESGRHHLLDHMSFGWLIIYLSGRRQRSQLHFHCLNVISHVRKGEMNKKQPRPHIKENSITIQEIPLADNREPTSHYWIPIRLNQFSQLRMDFNSHFFIDFGDSFNSPSITLTSIFSPRGNLLPPPPNRRTQLLPVHSSFFLLHFRDPFTTKG